jgi:hypothetical protein
MKKYLLIAAVLTVSGAAQAQVTNCYRTAGVMSCYTNPVYPRTSPLGAFLDGYMEGRRWRLQMEQLQLQNELLRRRLYGYSGE